MHPRNLVKAKNPVLGVYVLSMYAAASYKRLQKWPGIMDLISPPVTIDQRAVDAIRDESDKTQAVLLGPGWV